MAELTLASYVAAERCAERAVCAVQSGLSDAQPVLRLNLFTVRNGRFCIGPGLDGLVVTDIDVAVHEMAMFSEPGRVGALRVPHSLPEPPESVGDVFIGFDAAWTNWFHWLCFAVGRSRLAADLLPPSCRILLPDYTLSAHSALRVETCRQSLASAGLAERITLLPPGIYRAERIHFLWTNTPLPGFVTPLHAFQRVFTAMRRGLRRRPELPRRLLVARDRDANPRLEPTETALLHRITDAHGFTPVYFADLDFTAQAELMFNAEAVIGVHGAGMTNVLFAQRSLRVLELNRTIGEEPGPRPWFQLLCAARGQRYRMLHTEPGSVTADGLEHAISTLCAELPPAPSLTQRPHVHAPALLATVCNTTPNALPVALWLGRGDEQATIDLGDAIGRPGDAGLTGLAWHAGRLYCAVQTSTHPRILVLDDRLNPVATIASADLADLHSLTVTQNGLLIASTGNGRILRYDFTGGRIETLCDLGGDVHLNSACYVGSNLLICCQNLEPLDPTARHGGVYSLTERRVVLDDLGYPHSVMAADAEFIILDSGRSRLLRFERGRIVQEQRLDGFLRGASLWGGALFVAAGPQRLVSRSSGQIWHEQTLRQALSERVILYELDATTLAVRGSRQVVAAGFELYEVLALPAEAALNPLPERVLPADQTAFARLFYNAFMALQADRTAEQSSADPSIPS